MRCCHVMRRERAKPLTRGHISKSLLPSDSVMPLTKNQHTTKHCWVSQSRAVTVGRTINCSSVFLKNTTFQHSFDWNISLSSNIFTLDFRRICPQTQCMRTLHLFTDIFQRCCYTCPRTLQFNSLAITADAPKIHISMSFSFLPLYFFFNILTMFFTVKEITIMLCITL